MTSPSRGPAAARSALRDAAERRTAAIAALPSLHLMVWADKDGMNLKATVYVGSGVRGRRRTDIAFATWRPQEVTERSVVEWGERALAKWLAEHVETVSEGDRG